MSVLRIASTALLYTLFILFCDPLRAQDFPYNGVSRGSARFGAPKGWIVAGSNQSGVPANARNGRWPDIGQGVWTDDGEGLPVGIRFVGIWSGPKSMTGTHIERKTNAAHYTTVMQTVSAEEYRGKRVRFSAQLSTTDVAGDAILWMRVDGQNGKVLNFDDMASRALSGTKSWDRYEIVLDVPTEGTAVNFGFLLAGAGIARAAQFNFDVVDAGVSPTATGTPKVDEALQKAPTNLDLRL